MYTPTTLTLPLENNEFYDSTIAGIKELFKKGSGYYARAIMFARINLKCSFTEAKSLVDKLKDLPR